MPPSAQQAESAKPGIGDIVRAIDEPYSNGLRKDASMSLERAWKETKDRFNSKTKGAQLADFVPPNTDHLFDKWISKLHIEDYKDIERIQKLRKIVRSIVDCLDVVGSVAAEGASLAWQPAGPCFSALMYVLNIPRRIQDVYDTVVDLFEEIESFLVKFKVLKDVDSRVRLNTDLVLKVHEMLFCFVDVCIMSIDVLETRKVKTSLKIALLKDDSGTGNDLQNFRRLAQSLDSLINTVSLDHIITIEEMGMDTHTTLRSVEETGKETNITLKSVQATENQTFGIVKTIPGLIKESLAANNSDEKTQTVNKDRLKKIEERIYAKHDRFSVEEQSVLPANLERFLPNTLPLLHKWPEYDGWKNAATGPRRAALLLTGDHGSGKSCMMGALKGELDSIRLNAKKGEPSTYVALHVLSGHPLEMTDGSNKLRSTSSIIPSALRSMAVQVARQSTYYAADLEEQLLSMEKKNQSISQVDDIESLWSYLRLSRFGAPPGAVMYLLFDGIERESESNVRALLRLFIGSEAERHQKKDTLKIRAILTVDTKLRSALDFTIPEIRMDVVTRQMIQDYARRELKRLGIFQGSDGKSKTRRDNIIKAIEKFAVSGEPSKKAWNFTDVNHKLRQIYDAIQRDAPSSELKEILEDEPRKTVNPNRKKELDAITATLSSKQISEINQLLPWLLYSELKFEYWMEVDELEAVLFLTQNSDSLQSLTQKMQEHFSRLFQRRSGRVRLNPDAELILRQTEGDSIATSSLDEPRISLDISIRNAQESVVRQFIWKLNEQVSKGIFDFSSFSSPDSSGIYANKLEGHLTITKLCLKLLNEGWVEETEALIWYAREHLPKHFIELYGRISQISVSDKSMITQGLVSFLRDPYHLASDQDRHFGDGEYWLADSASKNAIRSWLKQNSSQLHGFDRRWVETMLQPSHGQIGYLREVACSVARRWSNHCKENAKERDKTVGLRKTNSLEQSLFCWLDRFIIHNLEPPSAQANGEDHTAAIGWPSHTITSDQISEDPAVDTDAIDTSIMSNDSTEDDQSSTPQRQLTNDSIPHIDSVLRAWQWMRQNRVDSDLTGPFRINIGYTYLGRGETINAMKHFDAALEDSSVQIQRQAETGLGRVNCALGNKVLGAEQLSKAASDFINHRELETLSSDERKVYAEMLREVAMIYEELDETSTALETYDQSLQCDDDLSTRWNLLRLLCEKRSVKHAVKRMDQWSDSSDDYGGKGLAQIVFQLANDDPRCEQLTKWVHGIQHEPPQSKPVDTFPDAVLVVVAAKHHEDLRSKVVETLSDAVQIAAKHPRSLARPGLLFLHGLALARGTDPSQRQYAVLLWRDALISNAPEEGPDFGYRYNLYEAAKGVALAEFEKFSAEWATCNEEQMTKDEKDAMIRKYRNSLQFEVFRNPNVPQGQTRTVVNRYITSMHILLDQVEEAQQVSSSQMADALGILGDDDSGNDLAGIRILLALFCSLGDRVGALTAFSLLDRPKAPPQAEDDATLDRQSTAPKPIHSPASLTRECDSCRQSISSADPTGLWYCQFCADFDLCSVCHHRFVNRELNLHFCDPDHSFMHMYHTEYTVEERAPGMIRIGWTWEGHGDGGFRRRGGRVVKVAEWLGVLQEEWRLGELDRESRAQK